MTIKRPTDDEARQSSAPIVDEPPAGSMGNLALLQSIRGAGAEPVEDTVQMSPVINGKKVTEAWQTLQEYRRGKSSLERRVIENQRWYRLRQWECMRKKLPNAVEPTSAWLFNAIANKHADAMDNVPRANILAREAGDREEAKKLSSIIPVVLDQSDFEQVYSDVMDDKGVAGTGIYGVFWDNEKLNGLGDISIEAIDILQIYWEPGITDIQKSRNVFYVTLKDNDVLESEYPQLKGKLSAPLMTLADYVYDDTIDTSQKSLLVDWYYKVRQGGRTVLHYCKFVAGQTAPLFATENEADYAERGWYDHGQYPFVFDALFKCKGTPSGFSYIDVGKSEQEYIDRGDQAIMQNLLFNAKPRHFIRNDGSVNETEYADTSKDFVHVDGNLGDDSIRPLTASPLRDIYVSVIQNKVLELKEVTGNRDVSTGGTTSGVTAASAIAAMQEAGSKLSRDSNKSAYRAYRRMILLVIELIRQFYDLPRQFRILGENGQQKFVRYSNAGIQPKPQGTVVDGVPMEMGVAVGYSLPVFDVDVTVEKASPYSRVSQNELALQFYGAGFFAPQNADAALVCLDMMDFDRKDFVTQKISRNATLLQIVQQQAQLLSQLTGGMTSPAPAVGMQTPGNTAPVKLEGSSESGVTKQARERTAELTAPQ